MAFGRRLRQDDLHWRYRVTHGSVLCGLQNQKKKKNNLSGGHPPTHSTGRITIGTAR